MKPKKHETRQTPKGHIYTDRTAIEWKEHADVPALEIVIDGILSLPKGCFKVTLISDRYAPGVMKVFEGELGNRKYEVLGFGPLEQGRPTKGFEVWHVNVL